MFAGLELQHLPFELFCYLPELPQQNGFAHTAKTGDDHGLIGAALVEPPQEDPEVLKEIVTADDNLRRRTRVRSVGVVHWIHVTNLTRFTSLYWVPIKCVFCNKVIRGRARSLPKCCAA